ncbi:MAG: TolC family protein [Elusimicrobia bacterium]|nr:TolC family protein [Elusimicrobiota bacterium]
MKRTSNLLVAALFLAVAVRAVAQANPPVASTTTASSNPEPAPAKSNVTPWTIEDVERLAIENNPDVQTALANVAAARAVIGEAASVYIPHISAQGQTMRTTLPEPSVGLTPYLGQAEPYSWGTVSFQQTLFDFGKGLEDILAARGARRAQQEQLSALRNDLVLAVQKAFYDVSLTTKLVGVAQRGVDRFKETTRDAGLLVKTGVRPPFDLTEANVDLVSARLELIKAENARDLAKVALLNLMGLRGRANFELVDSTQTPAVTTSQMSLDHLVDEAMDLRPEIRRDEASLQAARSTLAGGEVSLLPTLQAQGWTGGFAPNYPQSLERAWGIGLAASWNFFDGLYTPFRIRELSARRDAATSQLDKERLAVEQDVSNAYLNLGRAEQNRDVAEEALVFAKENLDLGQKRYAAGVGTILELLIAETSEFNAEAEELRAVYGLSTSVKALETAVNLPLENMK